MEKNTIYYLLTQNYLNLGQIAIYLPLHVLIHGLAHLTQMYKLQCFILFVLLKNFFFSSSFRQLLFYVTSFDRDRALLRLLDSVPELGAADGGQERVTPDLDRKKRVISRYVFIYKP